MLEDFVLCALSNGDCTFLATNFNFADWLGTERARTTSSGASCETITSLPFGDALATSGSCGDPSPMHFTGKEHDAETNLENFGTRYDSSSFARFMTPDWSAKPQGVPYSEFTDPQSLNLYAYSRNNPTTRLDKDGHCLWDLCIVEGIGVVEAASAVVALVSAGTAIYKFHNWVKKMEDSADSPANKNVVNDIVHPNEHPEQTIADQTKEIQNSTLDTQKQAKDTLEGVSAGAQVVGALTPENEAAGAASKVAGTLVEATNKAVENTADVAAKSLDQQRASQQQQHTDNSRCNAAGAGQSPTMCAH